jgi:uncharacterized protein (TIRG00374 family)
MSRRSTLQRVGRWLSAAFLLLGTLFFVLLVRDFGLERLLATVRSGGASLLLAGGLWFLVYLLNTRAWQILLRAGGTSLGFWQLFRLNVASFGLNYATPFGGLGGEPYKAYMLGQRIGAVQALSSVVQYRIVHTIGHLLLLLAGLFVAMTLTTLQSPAGRLVAVALPGTGLIVFGLLLAQQRGVFVSVAKASQRIRWLRPLTERVDRHQASLQAMDATLTGVPVLPLAQAVTLEFLSRVLMVVEVWILFDGIGVPISWTGAFVAHTLSSTLINLFFLVPFGIGALEAGFYLTLPLFGLDPLLSAYMGLALRVREMGWTLIGLALSFWLGIVRRDPERAPTGQSSGAAELAGRQ